ncbi:MAG: restriction endonuclease subunit S [Bacillota bacterium]
MTKQLPNNWRYKVVEELVSIKKGRKINNITNCMKENYYPLINIDNLRGVESTQFSDDKNGLKCNQEDVLIVWDGANSGTVGTGLEGYVGSTIAKLEIKDRNELNNRYFFYFLKFQFNYLNGRTTGATIPHIDRSSLVSLKVPIPSLEQQKKIVSILEKVEKAMLKRKEADELADKYLKSVFIEMFINNNDRENWDKKLISDLARDKKNSMRTGPFGSDLLHSEFVNQGISVIGIDNAVNNRFAWGERRYITQEKYKKLQRYTLYPGDVVITIMGTTGRSAVIPHDIGCAINSKHLAAITLNTKIANPYFISYSIHSDPYILAQIRAENKGAIMSGLNLGIIKRLEFKLPPMHLQNKFVEVLEKIEKLKQRQKQSTKELETLFNSLMQKAFRGELAANETGFNFESFIKIIKSEFGEKEFTFDELIESINNHFEDINYEDMKMYLFACMEENKLFLIQVFDENNEKEIQYIITDSLKVKQ